jgi:uncharacterized protein YndB with AHSA1/START domain
MKVSLIALGVVALLLIILIAVGYTLPVKHRATVDATIAAPPDRVYALITDVASFPSWRSGLQSVDSQPSLDGKRRWREVSRNGTIPFVVESEDPPNRFVGRIDSKSLPFGGTWTYELRPDSAGRTDLRITEDGEIYNPIFRLVSRFFIGYEGTIRQYLSDVERKLK